MMFVDVQYTEYALVYHVRFIGATSEVVLQVYSKPRRVIRSADTLASHHTHTAANITDTPASRYRHPGLAVQTPRPRARTPKVSAVAEEKFRKLCQDNAIPPDNIAMLPLNVHHVTTATTATTTTATTTTTAATTTAAANATSSLSSGAVGVYIYILYMQDSQGEGYMVGHLKGTMD
ncbi:hypothetical protein CRUP_017481 [Coryphaenoides rupestris]|nr:hypothetical protein CRUP_017481 [Coryphaenoides rupestris]